MVAVSLDAARLHPDAEERERHQALADLMIPVIKGWCTENSVDIASLGIQVHGGVGFVEETGAAQYLRDARITPIYEGTTAIQANDLIGRKLARDGGAAAQTVMAEMRTLARALSADTKLSGLAPAFSAAVDALERAIGYVVENYAHRHPRGFGGRRADAETIRDRRRRLAVAAFGVDRAAAFGDANGGDAAFYEAKILTARFYADYVLSQSPGWRTASCAARPARSPRVRSRAWGMDGRYPRRIVCLTEEPTEVLYALGLEERIVGISGFTVRPARARREKPRVSAFISAKLDRILELAAGFRHRLLRYPSRHCAGADQDAASRFGSAIIARSMASSAMCGALGPWWAPASVRRSYALELEAHIERVRQAAALLPRRPRVYFEEWDEPLITGDSLGERTDRCRRRR